MQQQHEHSPASSRPGKRARNDFDDDDDDRGSTRQQMAMYPVEDSLEGSSSKRGGVMFYRSGGQDPPTQTSPQRACNTEAQQPEIKEKGRKLSCKECRRLKLKCDRVFPCQSCIKRGCRSLCPEGALTSGRGSRFILANTEQLHEKIAALSDRVRELEDALQTAHTDQPHPLLTPELLRIKTSQDLYVLTSQQPSSSSGNFNSTVQRRPIATPLSLNILADSTSAMSLGQPPYAPVQMSVPTSRSNSNGGEVTGVPDVPPDILQLSATFPFPWSVDLSIRKRIRDALPPQDEALRVCEEARRNALWQYHLDASETFLQNLLSHCYAMPIEELSPRRLALLLMVLSIGSLVDLRRPLGSLYGEAYHHLARAAVCEIPLMEEPDFDVLHALFFMIWWHLIFSDNKKAVGYAWNLMGFVAKLAQGLGLHRDNPRMRGIPEEDERRRAIFWELLNLDARMSLSLGRPPSICLRHVDTKPPSFVGKGLYVPKEEVIYHEWKNAFFIQCLTPVLEAIVVVDTPPYSRILELDSLIREFRVPRLLEQPYRQSEDAAGYGPVAAESLPRFLVMQRALVATSRDIALLQLHRRFFKEAMSRAELFDIHTHAYAPSVLATCLGAASLVESVETLFEHEPQLAARFLYFWFNLFSATATLALFVARAPASPFAPEAQRHVDRSCRLFERASQVLPLCRGLLHATEKLADKSCQALKQYQSATTLVGLHELGRNDVSASSISEHERGREREGRQGLPESFRHAHPAVVQYLERQLDHSEPPSPEALRHPNINACGPQYKRPQPDEAEAWLPDIYRYANAGVSRDLRYPFPFPRQARDGQMYTLLPKGQGHDDESKRVQVQDGSESGKGVGPFVLGAPRINANEEFNFHHGALDLQCEEMGYMAWF